MNIIVVNKIIEEMVEKYKDQALVVFKENEKIKNKSVRIGASIVLKLRKMAKKVKEIKQADDVKSMVIALKFFAKQVADKEDNLTAEAVIFRISDSIQGLDKTVDKAIDDVFYKIVLKTQSKDKNITYSDAGLGSNLNVALTRRGGKNLF